MRRTKPLALLAAIAILALVGTAEGVEAKRRKFMMRMGDPFLAFVPGRSLLIAAEPGRSLLLLRYPELEVFKELEGIAGKKADTIKISGDGTWLAANFGGDLRVWKTSTAEPYFTLSDASGAFDFTAKNRLIVWQPKSGITQWELGEGEPRRAGTAITSVHSVMRDLMWLSPDGRYLLIKGTCRGNDSKLKTDWWAYCIYDLKDGSTIAWAEDPKALISENVTGKFPPEFSETLVATKIDLTGGTSECKPQGNGRELCVSVGGVDLRAVATSPGQKVQDRVVWTVGGRTEFGHFYNSGAVSADGKWAAAGVNGLFVLLYDTTQLDEKKAPALVKHFEMP